MEKRKVKIEKQKGKGKKKMCEEKKEVGRGD